MDPGDCAEDGEKMEGFEILQIKIEDENSDGLEGEAIDQEDGMVRTVKIEPGFLDPVDVERGTVQTVKIEPESLDYVDVKEERPEESRKILSTKSSFIHFTETSSELHREKHHQGSSDQEHNSMQTSDISNNKSRMLRTVKIEAGSLVLMDVKEDQKST
uniref:uncharacterized protein isoform X2 n=1 Tax=Myxine glutinosa TaxID=7769 RepID=UPI00358E3D3D